MANATLGVLTSASLAVHAIGQGLARARGLINLKSAVDPARSITPASHQPL